MRSRYNGFNGFVKKSLLKATNVEDKKLWPKEVVGKEITRELYNTLVQYKNTHLDDIAQYKRLVASQIEG